MGLHVVSLGRWNLEQINNNCCVPHKQKMDYIDFPYEPKEYFSQKRGYDEYSEKKEFTIAVYSKEDGKRIPNLMQIILEKAANELKKQGVLLNVYFFGFNKKTKLIYGQNLGKLNKNEMLELYGKADFGMVASMTNISLVPYEMIAAGLPLIEFSEGSFPFFFGNDSAILIDFNYHTLVNRIIEYTSEPYKIENIMKNALSTMKYLTWENSVDQFVSLLAQTE